MCRLKTYLDDGANYQAKAVLAYLQKYEGIKDSWDEAFYRYRAQPLVARWENCREQGYIVYMSSKSYAKQINIAFFEHRNSDGICAVKWIQNSINSITIENASFGDIYETKWDVSFSVDYGEVVKMSEWIWKELCNFWKETCNKKIF